MKKNNYPGKFIVIEGLDGSGKSVQIDLLVPYLKSQGREVIETREPTMESEAGRKIKKALKREIIVDAMELQGLYVQDRKEHLENKVIPALQKGAFVISSRYAFSTFAYGYTNGLEVDLLRKMNDNFLLPDITIFIDVSAKQCIKRIEKGRDTKELFEKQGKLEKAGLMYHKLTGMYENITVLNGEQEIPKVFEDIKKVILPIL